jgi:PhoPQ-activated pathogenicity-related protein
MTTRTFAALAWPLLGIAGLAQAPAGGPLFDYVGRPEPAFAWKQASNHDTPAGKVYSFEFTSQTWRGGDWTHQLRVYEPAKLEHPGLMLLFITGGRVGGEVKDSDHAQGFALAEACGARVAVLPQVPNQPLMGDRFEDDLIGETFVKFLETQEADWPLLFPMVKSAVKAMDALEAWATEKGTPLEGFVVTGASKRGWTTWLTGAVDPRVKAIAPMVIPTLNMKAQAAHQLDSWGKYSEQIEDYTRRGLTEKFDDPVGRKLWTMVDPYAYLDRIKVPVLQINGTNDRYWTLDSMNLFWDAIGAPKAVVYLPNAGHGLEKNRAWAIEGVAALLRATAAGKALPELGWSLQSGPFGGKVRHMMVLTVLSETAKPKSVRFWTATSPTRDFREAEWTPTEIPVEPAGENRSFGNAYFAPDEGYLAVFADAEFERDGRAYHLSTPIRILGKEGLVTPRVLEPAEAARP